jgi:hypothetical protein
MPPLKGISPDGLQVMVAERRMPSTMLSPELLKGKWPDEGKVITGMLLAIRNQIALTQEEYLKSAA